MPYDEREMTEDELADVIREQEYQQELFDAESGCDGPHPNSYWRD